ncbi:hypothetical protein [Gaetbulibacter aestuarii]|uniref:DUF4199 domain-containing protein n=1 Tax=Gaetbulibacter aestuarii TaxID=1502358 RepID=A0ABW7N3V6_9FLAO
MKDKSSSSSGLFNFESHGHWKDNQFAWFYASLILVASLILGISLYLSGVYESMSWRSVKIFFILFSFIALVSDYHKHKAEISYVEAVLLCLKTGFYFLAMYLPIIIIFLATSKTEMQAVVKNEVMEQSFSFFEMVFVNYLETVVTTAICAIAAAFTVGFIHNKKQES